MALQKLLQRKGITLIADQVRVQHLLGNGVVQKVILAKQAIKEFIPVDTIAALCLFLASEAATTITGTAMPVDARW